MTHSIADPAQVACRAGFILCGRYFLFGFHGDTLQVFGSSAGSGHFVAVRKGALLPVDLLSAIFLLIFCLPSFCWSSACHLSVDLPVDLLSTIFLLIFCLPSFCWSSACHLSVDLLSSYWSVFLLIFCLPSFCWSSIFFLICLPVDILSSICLLIFCLPSFCWSIFLLICLPVDILSSIFLLIFCLPVGLLSSCWSSVILNVFCQTTVKHAVRKWTVLGLCFRVTTCPLRNCWCRPSKWGLTPNCRYCKCVGVGGGGGVDVFYENKWEQMWMCMLVCLWGVCSCWGRGGGQAFWVVSSDLDSCITMRLVMCWISSEGVGAVWVKGGRTN